MNFVFYFIWIILFFGVFDDDIIYIYLIFKDIVLFFLFVFVIEKEGFC